MSEKSYLCNFSAQVSQIVFLAKLTVSRLITTVWREMSENSYLRDFSAQESQIRVLSLFGPFHGLLQLYDREMSENSFFREFSAQVSQSVLLS